MKPDELAKTMRDNYPDRAEGVEWYDITERAKDNYRLIATSAMEFLLLVPQDKWDAEETALFILRKYHEAKDIGGVAGRNSGYVAMAQAAIDYLREHHGRE